jgi:hypothetical protein
MAFGKDWIAVGVELRRRFNRRAAQGDIDGFAVWAGVDAARAFADRDGTVTLKSAPLMTVSVPAFSLETKI